MYVETVVLLSHKKPDSTISVKVEFGEGEGKVPLDNIAKRAEAYKPKERVTYKMIKEYIEAKYGFKVHTAYIAEEGGYEENNYNICFIFFNLDLETHNFNINDYSFSSDDWVKLIQDVSNHYNQDFWFIKYVFDVSITTVFIPTPPITVHTLYQLLLKRIYVRFHQFY